MKRSTSSPSSAGVAGQVGGPQRVLVGEQQVVHLPEPALGAGGLRRLGGELRARVHVVQRQVPPDVAEVAELGEQLADDRLGLPAERALEVAVLDERHRGLLGAADVVALGVDGDREVDQQLGRPEQRADLEPRSAASRWPGRGATWRRRR